MSISYTADEMMTVAASRMLWNGAVCFVGIGLPSTAANLARLTHAPDAVLIYELGPIGAKPPVLPLSIGNGNPAETADTVVSTPEKLGLVGTGPVAVITDLCTLQPDPVSRELEVASIHPGVGRRTIADRTGWQIRFAEGCDVTEVPGPTELEVLRDLKSRTAAAHGVQGDEA